MPSDGSLIRFLTAHTWRVSAVAFSQDGQMMIESRPGERLANGTGVYHPIINFPTFKDVVHPVGLAPQVSKSICTPAQVSLTSVSDLPIAESPIT